MQPARPAPRRSSCRSRRGIALLWVLIAGPAAITMLIVVTDTANLWSARTEYRNGLEAAALAGVAKLADTPEGERPDERAVRAAALAVARANTVSGVPIRTADADLTVQLGWYGESGFVEQHERPDSSAVRAVRVEGIVNVESLYGAFLTTVFGPYDIASSALAAVDDEGDRPRVVAE
jgi:hypothetical protein